MPEEKVPIVTMTLWHYMTFVKECTFEKRDILPENMAIVSEDISMSRVFIHTKVKEQLEKAGDDLKALERIASGVKFMLLRKGPFEMRRVEPIKPFFIGHYHADRYSF